MVMLTCRKPFATVAMPRAGGAGNEKLDACTAHEVRNEVVEEVISSLLNTSCAEWEAQCIEGGRNRGMEEKLGKKARRHRSERQA